VDGAYTYNWSNAQTVSSISGLAAAVYNATVTDIKGCQVTASATITDPTPITSSIAGTNVNCAGGSGGSATLTVNGGTPPYTFLWSNFARTQNITGVSGGLYHVIITDAHGCEHTDSVFITEPLPLTATVASTDVHCHGGNDGTITVTATGGTGAYSYTWSPTGGPGSSYTTAVAGTYSITVKDANLCSVVVGATITEPVSALSVTAVVTPMTCNNANNGSILVQVSGGSGAYTYAWGAPLTGVTTPSVSSLAAGTYTVTVTDAFGCTATASGTITNPTVITSTVVATDVTCAGAKNGSAHLTSVSGGTAPYTFLWSNFSITQNLDSLRGGIYYVIITDVNGCQKRDSGIVHEGLPIAVSDTFVPISCSGTNDASIHIIASGGTGTYTYVWSPSGPNSPDNTNLSANTYNVTVTDGNGCSASTSVVITNPSALSLSHVLTNPRCNAGNDGSITMIVAGGTAGYTFTWSGPGAPLSGNIANNVQAGTYHVTVTDAHRCTATDSIVVLDPAPMYISGIPKDVTCAGNHDGAVIATGYGGTQPYSYEWHYDSLAGNPGPITKDFLQLSGGDYYLIITDANNCTVSYHAVIKEADSLRISLVATDATCQSANSGAVAVIVTGGVKPYEFLWNNFATDSFQNGIPGGNYGVVVTDSMGCHQTKTIVVGGQGTPMTINTAINNPTCNGGTNGFVSLDVLGGVQPYTYNWSTTPAQTGNVAANLTGGTYYATVTDSKGCQLVDTATLTSPQAITAATAIGGATCVSASDGFVVINVTGGNAPYTYQLGNTVQATDTFRNLAVGVYTLIVKDVNGCEGSTSLNVAAPGYFTVDLTATPAYILAGESVQLHADTHSDTTVTGYVWNLLDSLSFQGCPDTSNCNDAVANPRYTRTYTVTAVNARGCQVSGSVLVTVSDHPSAFIPTAFTPNGDGLNDKFEFDILGAKSADVGIWNRWGEKVFSNPNQLNGINNLLNGANVWDGSFRGKSVQYDTYIYQVNVTYFDGHKEMLAGTVTVMK
jgi:gliding motility-associated-like protein